MIVIFSFPGDKNTVELIDWLIYYGVKFKRVDLQFESFKNIKISCLNSKTQLTLDLISGETLNLNEVNFFYVRGKGFLESENLENKSVLPNVIYNKYMNQEEDALKSFFYNYVNQNSIGSFITGYKLNKLNQYKTAIEIGLSMPNYFITNNKKDLHKKRKGIITKGISDNIACEYENNLFVQRVQRINELKEIEDRFFPSFFQDEIKKAYEIRSYFLEGKLYTIAYHSNNVAIDGRDSYNDSNYYPYTLPSEIKDKLKTLMSKLNLKSGSIDMIKSKNNIYYFLEVNPNGQYDWVSQFGGYHLHKKIAQYLITKCENHG